MSRPVRPQRIDYAVGIIGALVGGGIIGFVGDDWPEWAVYLAAIVLLVALIPGVMSWSVWRQTR